MKNKKIYILLISLCVSLSSIFSQQEIDNALKNLTDELTKVVPETTTQLTVTPDAFIGKLFPSVPPHFAIGGAVAGTFIKTKELSSVANKIISELNKNGTNIDFTLPDMLPFPAYSINARLGGFVLPFDMGFYGSYLSTDKIKFSELSSNIKYWTIGADVRYAIFQGTAVIPKLSVGVGYIYTHSSLGINFATSVKNNGNTYTANANFDTNIDMHTIFAQIQLSKNFLIFTPYIGGRAYITSTKSNYSYSTTSSDSNINASLPKGEGNYQNGNIDLKNIQPQIYAGLGLNLVFFALNIGGNWNPRSNLWGVNISANFKM